VKMSCEIMIEGIFSEVFSNFDSGAIFKDSGLDLRNQKMNFRNFDFKASPGLPFPDLLILFDMFCEKRLCEKSGKRR